MAKGQQKLNKKKVKDSIPGSYGIISDIARKCGVTRKAIYDFLIKNPDIQQLVEDERDMLIEDSESELIKHIHEGNFKAIRFVLSTIGSKKGYVSKQELVHSGESVNFQFVGSDNNYPDTKDKKRIINK